MASQWMFNLQKRKLLKEYIKRYQYSFIDLDYFLLKVIISSKLVSKQTRVFAIFYLSLLCSKTTKTKHKNVCLRSGYRRSVINSFGLNRCFVRDELGKNLFPGYSSAKW